MVSREAYGVEAVLENFDTALHVKIESGESAGVDRRKDVPRLQLHTK